MSGYGSMWGDLPQVTPQTDIVQKIVESVQEAPSYVSGFLPRLACCGSGKNHYDRMIWDTQNIGFFGWQARRLQSLSLAKSIYRRMNKALVDHDAFVEQGQHDEARKMWDRVNTENAQEIREHAEEAKGLFIKATQQMSTMVGILPDVYIEEFQETTENLPVSSPEEVYSVLELELMAPPTRVFSAFDRKPVASASIGQVHKARLAESGELVAVKVQHAGVDTVFMEDLTTLGLIAEKVAAWAPDMDFRQAVEEWREILPRELDFQDEMASLARANDALKLYGSPVRVPKPFMHYSTQRVMIMEFVDAWPIARLADSGFCREKNIDKAVVMRNLVEAFAILVFRDGLIHGDPHAGNIRCEPRKGVRGGAVPVIFDWGMTRVLTAEERVSLAKFFHSLANMDLTGIFESLEFLGFKFAGGLTDEMREELVRRLRNMMKDTLSKEKTTELARRDMQEARTKIAERSEGTGPKAKIVEGWPKCVVFFLRMTSCMRGLCVLCGVEGLPVLEIFTKHARDAFKELSSRPSSSQVLSVFVGRDYRRDVVQSPKSPEKSSELQRFPSASQEITENFRRTWEKSVPEDENAFLTPRSSAPQVPQASSSRVEQQVRARLDSLVSSKGLVGVQVAVLQAGRQICNVNFGTLSTIDMRPITQNTRFPLLGAVLGVANLAFLRTLRRERPRQGLDLPVSQLWPEFGSGCSQVNLRMLLGHAAGVQDAFPADFGPRYLNHPAKTWEYFELARLPEDGAQPRYAYILQTFIISKLADALVQKNSLLQWLRSELGPLGLDVMAPAGSGGEAVICRDLPSLSKVSMGEVQENIMKREASKEKERAASEQVATNGEKSGVTSTSASFNVQKVGLMEAAMKNPLSFDPLQANTGNTGRQFCAGMPLVASARGLATMLSQQRLFEELQALGALVPERKDTSALGWALTGGACQFSAGGVQVVQAVPFCTRAICSKIKSGYGMVCGLGPCAIHFPDLVEGGLTIAVLVNDILRGREVAADLVTEVLSCYGYKPSWSKIPLRVMAEATRELARADMAGPLMSVLKEVRGSGTKTQKSTSCSCCG